MARPLAWMLLAGASLLAGQESPNCCLVRVTVRAQGEELLPEAKVRLALPGEPVTAVTGTDGKAILSIPSPGAYRLEVTRGGYQPLWKELEIGTGETIEVEFTLIPLIRTRQSVTVRAEAPTAEESSSQPTTVTGAQVDALPSRPATVREALPLIPGVTRTPEGKLRISDSPEHRSTLLVNLMDVTDPATGDFGTTVPIDAVATLSVYKSPFLAEYGRFTAGVVAVNTRGGGDKWRWELNDPTPEFRIRSRHLRGIRGFTPRLSGSGPLIRNRLYLSQAVEYQLKKTPVFTLPFPYNEAKRESWNSLTQVDYAASASHLLTVTLHGVPQRIDFVNLNFYDPQPATPNFRGRELQGSVADRLTVRGGLLESAISLAQTTSRTGTQGGLEFTFTPTGNSGNYFARHDRRAGRFQWLETYSPAPFAKRGVHHVKFGGTLITTSTRGYFAANPVNIRGLGGELIRRIEYANRDGFRLSDVDVGLFVQDHWELRPNLSLDLGVRSDHQNLSGLWKIAPRAGMSWSPSSVSGMVLRSGFGWFYDRVPLNVYAFDRYPEQIVTLFQPDGSVIDGPRRFRNVTESVDLSKAPLVFGSKAPGNFAPRSATWMVQAEQPIRRVVLLRATYLQSRSSGLVVLRPGFWEGMDALLLGGEGRSRQRQLEIVSRVSWREEQQLIFSYVHSWSRGHLNDFAGFLGNFPTPLIREDVIAETPANTPHRFLAWGVIPLSRSVRIAPTIEYRTGFPYIVTDAGQNYVGQPNSRRFPNFFSLDFRIARDIHYRKHAFRVSASVFNLTNHFNPDTVRLNVADLLFGQFLGHHKRRYRLDFDFLF